MEDLPVHLTCLSNQTSRLGCQFPPFFQSIVYQVRVQFRMKPFPQVQPDSRLKVINKTNKKSQLICDMLKLLFLTFKLKDGF